MSVRTYGLTHIALAVRNVERASRFYQKVFGARETHRRKGFIQVETPDCHDVIVFEESTEEATKAGGVMHFGFRLIEPKDIDAAVHAVQEAGGKILKRGEFVPGEPYVFFCDPDGYEVEIWYE